MRFSFLTSFLLIISLVFTSLESKAQLRFSFGQSFGCGVTSYPHFEEGITAWETSGNVYPGLNFSIGVSQRIDFTDRWSVELEQGYNRSNFEKSKESTYMDFLTGEKFKMNRGHFFKLNSWQFPLRIRYSLPDKNGAFSFFAGAIYRRNANSKLSYFSDSENLSTGEITSIEGGIKNRGQIGNIYVFDFTIEKPNRFFWLFGVGRRFGQHFQIDISAELPTKKNSLEYGRGGYERYEPFHTRFSDSNFSFKFSYWVK